jgi:hypothetical protein
MILPGAPLPRQGKMAHPVIIANEYGTTSGRQGHVGRFVIQKEILQQSPPFPQPRLCKKTVTWNGGVKVRDGQK